MTKLERSEINLKEKSFNFEFSTIRIKQLRVSANRWHYGFQLCFKTFANNCKIANNTTTAESREKMSAGLESLEF